jgi:TRAP-type C4-dicarboxylate transport system substrate-binding protein
VKQICRNRSLGVNVRSGIKRLLLIAATLLVPVPSGHAQAPIQVRMATIAPKGTSPHLALMAMGEKWNKSSGGRVRLTIFPDGTQGGEADSVRRIRVRQLNGCLLTVTGLADIEPSASALQNLPMMFQSLAEVDYVQQKLTPDMERRFMAKGFVVLSWGDLGWVRFFSKAPLLHPDDLKTMKVFTWAGDPYQSDIMKAAGYNPIPLETNDIFTGLQTGLIDAVPSPPMGALAGQFDTKAKNMLELNWAPLVGGIVIDKRTWDGFPKEWQEAFRKAAQEAGEEIKAKGRSESTRSVAAMQKRGLKVQTMTPPVEAEWQRAAEEVYPKIRGTIVPADMFDRVQALLKEYRSAGGKK